MVARDSTAALPTAANSARLFALGRGSPHQFVNENCAGKTARTCCLPRTLQGNVVIDDNHFDWNAFSTRHLGRQTEVQPVAGVVLDHQQRSRPFPRPP